MAPATVALASSWAAVAEALRVYQQRFNLRNCRYFLLRDMLAGGGCLCDCPGRLERADEQNVRCWTRVFANKWIMAVDRQVEEEGVENCKKSERGEFRFIWRTLFGFPLKLENK